MHEVSKDEASHWRTDKAKRHIANKYTLPNISWPIREEWNAFVIPSTHFLDRVDATRSKIIDKLRENIRPSRHRFEDKVANPIQFESDHPEMTIYEGIDLYESFYWLEPVEGQWGSWKCM